MGKAKGSPREELGLSLSKADLQRDCRITGILGCRLWGVKTIFLNQLHYKLEELLSSKMMAAAGTRAASKGRKPCPVIPAYMWIVGREDVGTEERGWMLQADVTFST